MNRENKQQSSRNSVSLLSPGTPAPAFILPSGPEQTISLTDYYGSPVILSFYPVDWSPVCGDQMVGKVAGRVRFER